MCRCVRECVRVWMHVRRGRLHGRQVNTAALEWRVAADVIFARLMSLMESGAYLAGATQFAGCD